MPHSTFFNKFFFKILYTHSDMSTVYVHRTHIFNFIYINIAYAKIKYYIILYELLYLLNLF